jgi:hypothetical protein
MKKRLKLGLLGMFVFITACANTQSTPHTAVNVAATVTGDAANCPSTVVSTSCGATSETVCAHSDDDLIEWSKGNSQLKDFTIKVHHDAKICKTNGSGKTKCKVKKPNESAFGDADGLAFKYDIEAPGCATIDPYIIVRR